MLILGIGVIFGFLGALCAYIIMYGEYVHHYPNNEEPKRLALQAGLMTFAVFMLLSGVLAVVLPYVVK